MHISFCGVTPEIEKTLEYILPEVGFKNCQNAEYKLTLEKGENLRLTVGENSARITYANRIQLCRALSHLKAHISEVGFAVEETPVFENVGIMLNPTEGAPKPEKLQWELRKLALMGNNFALLYAEDTYEIEGEPYFGYMRGRYTYNELKAIDDYADALGIEIVPCIQTLGHMQHTMKWPAYANIRNTHNILLVDEPQTYAFIEKSIRAASAPFRTKRIHIGLDEAWEVAEGEYRKRHGICNPEDLMGRHIARIVDICRGLDLRPMMWSDMYFSIAFGFYYEREKEWPAKVLKNAVPGMDYVYWDYYSSEPEVYDHVFHLHRQLGNETVFAGGIYTWFGPFPDYTKTFEFAVPGLESALRNNIKDVFATVWGSDTNDPLPILYGMLIYTEFCYSGKHDKAAIDRRFQEIFDVPAQPVLEMDAFDHIPGDVVGKEVRSTGSPKRADNLLFEDPLAPLFEKDFAHIDLVAYYSDFYDRYTKYTEKYPQFAISFRHAAQFGKVLYKKCIWRQEAPAAIRAKDRKKAAELAAMAKDLKAEVELLQQRSTELWCHYNKLFNVEMLEYHIGGVAARFATAARLMEQFAKGEIDDIETLSCEKLPFSRYVEGVPDGLVRKQTWQQVASVNSMVRMPFV